MISETNFSKGYSSFWAEYFPWLNSYCQSVNKYNLHNERQCISEIDLAEHRAINNSIAFLHFRNIASHPDYDLKLSRDEGISFMRRFQRNSLSTYSFNESDQKIILAQVKNLTSRYSKDVLISPFFPGCGILDNCYGDIIQGNKLTEVKAGNRQIIPADIRQLLVYSALNWISSSEKYEIEALEIYNPRVGYSWSSNIDDLLISIADIPKEDVLDQLTKHLLTLSEDVEIL